MLIIYSLIIVAALVGIVITINIYKKKHEKKPLVCPFGADCNTVINSSFSSFLGIGLEIYGALYYALIALTYLTFIVFPVVKTPMVLFFVTGATIGAVLFSFYLTFVQAFYIKTWCSWCLMSASISTAIFIFSMIGLSIMDISFIPIFIEYKNYIVLMHLIGFALGVGGATISDILFLRFLKDFKISNEEHEILKLMSQIVWVGLLLIVISGIGLYLPETARLLESGKFLIKMIVVLIIIINGALLNLLITPKLITMSFKTDGINIKNASKMRHLAFALGAVSFVSWYTAFILGFAKNVPFSFLELLSMYVGALIIGVIVSQILEYSLCRKSSTTSSTIVH